MSIRFFGEQDTSAAYPKYVLESEDGSYRVEKTLRDLVEHAPFSELRFENLRGSKRYTLRRFLQEDDSEILFKDRAYADIVGQEQAATAKLVEGRFALEKTRHSDRRED